MSQDRPSEPPPSERPADLPMLDYHTPFLPERFAKPSRRPLPPNLGYGFLGAVAFLFVCWPILAERYLPHIVLYIAVLGLVIGIGLTIVKETRLAGLGALAAVALWLLLVGSCSAIGFVKPGAI